MKHAVDRITRLEHHLIFDADEVDSLLYALQTFDQYYAGKGSCRNTQVGQFCRDLIDALHDRPDLPEWERDLLGPHGA
jgi:hypothetical protein